MNAKTTPWAAILVTLIALGALAIIDMTVPYSWKVFVLAKIFKVAWAASAALVLAAASLELFPRLLGGAVPELAANPSVVVRTVTAVTAATVAFVTLGYLMPDWDPWTEGIAALAIAVWVALMLVATLSGTISNSRQ